MPSIPLPPPAPPAPPFPPSLSRDVICSKTTSRYLLTGQLSDGTIAIDSVGGRNGTIHGFSPVFDNSFGVVGLEFDGNSTYVDLGSHTFGGAISFSFWARCDIGDYLYWARFFDFGSGAPQDNIILSPSGDNFGTGGGGLTGVTLSGTTSAVLYSNFFYELSTWTHYTWTIDAAGFQVFYVNGAQVSAGVSQAVPLATRTNMYIGRSAWITDPMFQGAISDFQIMLGSVLTPTDALNLAQGRGCPNPQSRSPPSPL